MFFTILIFQLTSLQTNHKETVDELGDKSRQVLALRNELDRMSQQNHALADEVAMYENKTRQLRLNLNNAQDLHRQQAQEVRKIGMKCQ